MILRDEARVGLYRVFWRKDNEVYTVWIEESSNFIELSEDSYTALKLLQQGKALREVSSSLKEKYAESYDIKEFVSELMRLGFVSSIDGIPVPLAPPKGKTFPFIKTRHVSWIYSKPLLFFYIALIIFAVTILFSNRTYIPKYSDYFFHDSYLVVLVVSILTGLVLVFTHEFAHLIAGKAVGVQGYFSLGMRLYFPVAETNLTQLWSVPRRKRYIPFLAGMLNDGLIIVVVIILLWLSDLGLIFRAESMYAFAKFLIFILSYRILWQFLFFIRTDVYYVISTLLGCRNLSGDSWSLILNTLLSPFGRVRTLEIPPKELRIVKLYAPFMLVGTVLSTSFFVLFGLPILIQILLKSLQMLALSFEANLPTFIEGFLLTCLVLLQIIGFLYFLIRIPLQIKAKKR